MSLSELIPKLRALSRSQKWQLVHLMVADLSSEEGLPPIESGQTYFVWSPHHAFDAAEAMLKALQEEKGK